LDPIIDGKYGFTNFAEIGMFGQKDGMIKQIILKADSTEFVKSQQENQPLYIHGLSPRSMYYAKKLTNTTNPIAIFYDPLHEDQRIHYIGHYRPISSTAKWFRAGEVFMGRRVCMYIELRFLDYKKQLVSLIRKGD
jgi:hypothetical protein